MCFILLGRREIKALPVRCDNSFLECDWVGSVGTLEEHLSKCDYALLPCPNECKDWTNSITYNIPRRNLKKHLEEVCRNRDYSCEHCGEKGTYASTQEHYKKCEKKEIICPEHGCVKMVQRQYIMWHKTTQCKYAIISCKYASIGCKTKLKRKDMAVHEQDDTAHLHVALERLHKKSLDEQSLKFKFTNYQENKEMDEVVVSPSYYSSPNGYHIAMKVYANGCGSGYGTHVSVYVKFLEGDNDAQLKWPFDGNITFILLNQLEDKHHHSMTVATLTAECDLRVGRARGKPLFIPHSALGYDAVNNTQYLKDDTLYFRILVEPADHKPWLQ